MGVTGVYKVTIVQFEDTYDMELHIKENKYDVVASLKNGMFTSTFYNGSVNVSPTETESHNFFFHNAQIDNYTMTTVDGKKVDYFDLTPPGGYHIGGVVFAGTVLNGELTGTVVLKNGLVSSMRGKKIEGEPVVNVKIRTDGFAGVNRYCTCGTGSCTHHGFCDSCQTFEALHTRQMPGRAFLGPLCMAKKYEKLFGPMNLGPLPPTDTKKTRPEHGPHHLADN